MAIQHISWSPPWKGWDPGAAGGGSAAPIYVSGKLGFGITTAVVTRPATVVSGDYLVAYVVGGGVFARTFAVPTGFSSIVPKFNTYNVQEVFGKKATASEPATYTFSSSSGHITVALLNFRGLAATPVNAHGSATSTSTAVAFNRVTTTAAPGIIVLGVTTFTNATFTTPTGTTARLSHSTTTDCLAIFTASQAAAGQIPAYTSTASKVYQGWTALTVALV